MKTNKRLCSYMGLAVIAIGFAYWGVTAFVMKTDKCAPQKMDRAGLTFIPDRQACH